MVGITGYASYLPSIRIKAEEFKKAWGSAGGGFKEKAVLDFDEDIITMGYEAGSELLERRQLSPEAITHLGLASTNYPYAEKVMASSIVTMLGLPATCFTSEHGNSTLAGTSAVVEAWRSMRDAAGENAMVIVSDAPRGPVDEAWENPLGAGAVALTMGDTEVICTLEAVGSHTSEVIGERFRPEGMTEIQELGIASYSKQANERAMQGAVKDLLNKTGLTVADFQHVVMDQKNGKQVTANGKKLGFSQEQMSTGLSFAKTGDVGTASSFFGLCNVLDIAAAGDRILLVSYGGGSASHALSLKVNETIENFRRGFKHRHTVVKYINYLTYLKLKRAIL